MDQHQHFLQQAIDMSAESVARGAFPVGAVLVVDNKVIATGVSDGKRAHDATSHAEIAAIRAASEALGMRNLKTATLYSSMEPCLMCWSASFWAYIPTVVYAVGRARLSPMHFEGTHDLQQINQASVRPLEIVHLPELEESALKVITDWEVSIASK